MDIETKIDIFEEKIQEYYLSCLPEVYRNIIINTSLAEFPLYKFNTSSIFKSIRDNQMVPENLLEKCADKLIDIKLIYCYLITTSEHFYRGATLIVGNNELEKLNPNTMSLLRENHYKVYLLSVIIENILDFLHITFKHEIASYKRGKWEKILKEIKEENVIKSMNEENIKKLIAFNEKYRTAELHKYSAVRAFTSRKQWNHFQDETDIVRDIIADMTEYFTQRRP